MISNILIRFKIFMGDNLSNNLEDSLFNIDHLRKKNKDLSKDQLIEIIRNNLKIRNDKYKVWGWKYPRSINYLENINDDLINPNLLYI